MWSDTISRSKPRPSTVSAQRRSTSGFVPGPKFGTFTPSRTASTYRVILPAPGAGRPGRGGPGRSSTAPARGNWPATGAGTPERLDAVLALLLYACAVLGRALTPFIPGTA